MAKKQTNQTPEVAMLAQQVADLTAALQRERADAENLRRRFDTQIASLKTMARADVTTALLPVIDNFERALKHVPQELASNDYVKGIEAIIRQFEKTFEDLGVQKIPTVGQSFNPHLHEAVSMEQGDGDHEIVSEELQPGYTLGSGDNLQVLRPAMVRVTLTSK